MLGLRLQNMSEIILTDRQTDRQTDGQTEVNLPVFVLSAYRYSRGSSCPFQPDG
mgnify:CR=1 FL=1